MVQEKNKKQKQNKKHTHNIYEMRLNTGHVDNKPHSHDMFLHLHQPHYSFE